MSLFGKLYLCTCVTRSLSSVLLIPDDDDDEVDDDEALDDEESDEVDEEDDFIEYPPGWKFDPLGFNRDLGNMATKG